MSDEDYELFKLLVQSSQEKLHKMLYKLLKRHYTNIEHTQEYTIAQGDIPIALVAHMDTVFRLPPRNIYFDRQEGVLWSPDGLGADDRAGVFLILKILSNVKPNKKPTIIFTTDEEQGCVGSLQLVDDIEKVPWDLKYIIQLDRRGKDDCVFYDDINEEFAEYVQKFGFKNQWGTLSDISIICPFWGVSGVNLSVGYEDEHQEIETLHIAHMYATFFKVLSMLSDVDNAKHYEYKENPHIVQWWKYKNLFATSTHPGYDDEPTDTAESKDFCWLCGKNIKGDPLSIKIKDDLGQHHYVCHNCAKESVSWCKYCGSAFIDMYNSDICPDCIAKTWEMGDTSYADQV